MTIRNNATPLAAPVTLVPAPSAQDDMAAFDSLPPELRAAYNRLPIKGDATRALAALRAGVPLDELLRRIAANEARFGLSFVGPTE